MEKEPDIVVVSESWTNDGISNAEITFPGYNLVGRKDRTDTKNGRGGGLLIYAKDVIVF